MDIEKLLQQILENQVKMQVDITNIKSDQASIRSNQERMEKKIDGVVDQVAGLTEFKDSTTEKLDQISKDVRFIKKKSFQNEEEIFHLKETFQFSK